MSILSIKALNGAIKSINTTSKNFNASIQAVLPSCAFQMLQGNSNYFNELLNAVGKGTRKEGIVKWAELYGFSTYAKEKLSPNKSACKSHQHLTNEADFMAHIAENGLSVNWYEIAKAEKIASIFAPDAYLERVSSHLTKEGYADIAAEVTALLNKVKKDIALKAQALESLGEPVL